METRNHPLPTVLISTEDVELFRSSPFATWRLKSPVELALLNQTPDLRWRLENRVNHLASVCGCAEGSIAGAVALVILIMTWVGSGEGLSWRRALTTLAIIVCVAMVAKVVRVTIARIQMRGVLREILNHATGTLAVTKLEALR